MVTLGEPLVSTTVPASPDTPDSMPLPALPTMPGITWSTESTGLPLAVTFFEEELAFDRSQTMSKGMMSLPTLQMSLQLLQIL